MAISKKVIRVKVFNSTSCGYCPICGRDFGYIDEYNIDSIDAHHQTRKTMNISRACGYGFDKAMKEFTDGDCIWVHRDCHKAIHKMYGKGTVVVGL